MENVDLIDLVRPAGGWYGFLAVKDKTTTRQCMVETRAELDAEIEKYVADKWCVFFTLAKFKTGENRTQENVESLKSYWLDIDCGPNKSIADEKTGKPSGYETQKEGLAALRIFCTTVGLPKPMLVNSGNGLHAYWPLVEDVPRDEWVPVVKKLRQLCIDNNFYIDTKVFECARVLRPINSFNFKGVTGGGEGKPVTLLSVVDPIPFETIRSLVGVSQGETTAPKHEMSMLNKALMQNNDSLFSKIMQRSLKGEGCAQLSDCYTNRATLAEPRWFDALSVAKFCSDRDTAIHKLSDGHPDYEHSLVEKKVEGIKGPHTCAEFNINNPGGCEGCTHRDKVKSPILLGRVIARANSPTVTVELEGELVEEHEIPTLPEGYFRGANGGIYKEGENGDDEDEASKPKLVYENFLYVVKLMEDPIEGFVAVLKHHLPKDGVKQFVIFNSKLTEQGELRKELAKYGVIATQTRHKYITEYLMAFIKELQHAKKAQTMRQQFGWADNDSKFIVGDREVTATGIYHSPPASSIANMVDYFRPKGSLEDWKEAFALYGRKGLEIQAFGALSGFGAPLLKFTGQKGAVINFIHPDSGTGKTTILRMANSVFGDPEMLLGTPEDTDVGKILKVGFLNNIVNTMDEITNMSPLDASRTLYAYSQGRGKDKAKANANELRENTVTWRTLSIASSNASFYEKLAVLKSHADGEMMRLLEFKVPPLETPVISTQEGKDLLDHTLNSNYGVAGDIYIQYVIANLEEVKNTVLTIQAKFDQELRLSQRERNWSAACAVIIAGGHIAKKIGLLPNFDIGAIYREVSAHVLEMRKDTAAPVSNPSTVIGDFINRHNNNMLVVEDGVDKRTNKGKVPELLPKGPLLMRYEPDTKRVYITSKTLKDDCVDLQLNYKDTLKELEKNGVLLETINKRLSKGSSLMSTAVRCLVFDASHPDFMDMDIVVEAGAEDASGEG
jgi:hypothetical protein